MANDPTVIDLLYDLLEQQPTNLYIWERIIEAWEARNERGTLRRSSESPEMKESMY